MENPPPGVDPDVWARGIAQAREARDVGVRELGDMASALEGSSKVDDMVKLNGARHALLRYREIEDAEASLH